MKGIVLAGGSGTRLWPLTKSTSKQLLPVYDKPMIYYPISTLMLSGIREILIITTPSDLNIFKNLLGDGSDFGISLSYKVQEKPEGLAQALTIGEDFLGENSCLLILGDNIFHGVGLGAELIHSLPNNGAHVFTYNVSNPSDYGVLEVDSNNQPISIIEKPKTFVSNLAVTGLYFFDNHAAEFAKTIKPSARGELEITSLIEIYLRSGKLTFTHLTRGTAWLDTGSPEKLNDASAFVRIIEERTGLKIGCPEEIALTNNWITSEFLQSRILKYGNSDYGKYLINLISDSK